MGEIKCDSIQSRF